MQVGKFLENIKRADQNKAVQGEISSQLINVHALLFGTLEYNTIIAKVVGF